MSPSIDATTIRERVDRIQSTPCIPAVLLPLLELMKAPPERVRVEEVVELVCWDNTIAAQCLRVASSPLFCLAKPPDSIKSAVISLGLRRVETILLTCCMPQAFPAKNWILDPSVFWTHSLGCAMVCRKLSEKMGSHDSDQAYMAGLLHDIGFIVNSLTFPEEFAAALDRAWREQMPLAEAELTTMGFTHCETGSALARKWNLSDDLVDVIAHHHAIDHSTCASSMVALVHLSDLLCRMRRLGYGYYERHKVDLANDPAWSILLRQHGGLAGVDLARFTYELDDAVSDVSELVSNRFGTALGET